ncbi:MAG TPA: HTTM domain-containing protein [bacterium]|nr:HTTM domain-containing protein [bacterium]
MKSFWNRLWFEPASPVNLGVCRALIFTAYLIRYLAVPLNVSEFALMSSEFWKPLPVLGFFVPPLATAFWLRAFETAWFVALALSALGLFTRLSTALAFLLGAYLLWIPHNFGKLHHNDMITVLVTGVLMFSRCGEAWSLDRFFENHRRKKSGRPPETVAPSGEFTWPVRLVWLALATVFFAAGVSKLRHSGLAWITSDNLALMLIKANYMAYIDYPPLLPLGVPLGRLPWACHIIAAATMATELGFPLVLVSRRVRRVLVPVMFFVLIGIMLLFLPSFPELIACFVFFVPWENLKLRSRVAAA